MPELGLIKTQYLQDMAKALRDTSETNQTYAPSEMAEGIREAGRKQYLKGYNDSPGEDYIPEYGVRWIYGSSTQCIRLGDAAKLNARAARPELQQEYYSDFDNCYPWSEMKTEKIQCSNENFSSDMIKIPKFYYKRLPYGDHGFEIWIAPAPKEGYELHPIFLDNGNELEAVYHSAYNVAEIENGADSSLIVISNSDIKPTVHKKRGNFRTAIQNKGVGWSLEDLSTVSALQMLYLVEYADTNSYKTLGHGITNLTRYEACQGNFHTAFYDQNDYILTTDYNTMVVKQKLKGADRFQIGDYVNIGKTYRDKIYTPDFPIQITNIINGFHIDTKEPVYIIIFDSVPWTEDSYPSGSVAIWHDTPVNTNVTETIGAPTGCASENGKTDVVYRGICGFHGRMFRHIDGVHISDDNKLRYSTSIAKYQDADENTATISSNENYNKLSFDMPAQEGLVAGVGYDSQAPWILFPNLINIEAPDGTYLSSDYYYNKPINSNKEVRDPAIMLYGGNMTSTSAAGIFYYHCYEEVEEESYTVGAHMIYKKKTSVYQEGYDEGYETGLADVDYLKDEFEEISNQLNIPYDTPISAYSDIIDNTIAKSREEGYNDGKPAGKEEWWKSYLIDNGAPVYLFAGRHWNDKSFYPPTINMNNLANAEGIFYYSNISNLKQRMKDCDFTLDFSKNCQSLVKGFAKSNITYIPSINPSYISNVNNPCNLTELFDGCSKLISVDGIYLNNAGTQDLTNSFRGCNNLENCPVKGGKVGKSVDFTACSKLNRETISTWMNYLLNLTGQSSQTIKFNKTAVDKAFEGFYLNVDLPDEPTSFYTDSITDMANITDDEIINIILAEDPTLLETNNWISIFSKTNKTLLGQIIVLVFQENEGYRYAIDLKSTNGQVLEKTIGSKHADWTDLVHQAKSKNWRVYLDNTLL